MTRSRTHIRGNERLFKMLKRLEVLKKSQYNLERRLGKNTTDREHRLKSPKVTHKSRISSDISRLKKEHKRAQKLYNLYTQKIRDKCLKYDLYCRQYRSTS